MYVIATAIIFLPGKVLLWKSYLSEVSQLGLYCSFVEQLDGHGMLWVGRDPGRSSSLTSAQRRVSYVVGPVYQGLFIFPMLK